MSKMKICPRTVSRADHRTKYLNQFHWFKKKIILNEKYLSLEKYLNQFHLLKKSHSITILHVKFEDHTLHDRCMNEISLDYLIPPPKTYLCLVENKRVFDKKVNTVFCKPSAHFVLAVC